MLFYTINCIERVEGAPAEMKILIMKTSIYQYFAWALTFGYVILLWVPFRSPDFPTTAVYYSRLFTGASGIEWIHSGSVIILSAVLIWHILYFHQSKWLLTFPSQDPLSPSRLYPILASLMLIRKER